MDGVLLIALIVVVLIFVALSKRKKSKSNTQPEGVGTTIPTAAVSPTPRWKISSLVTPTDDDKPLPARRCNVVGINHDNDDGTSRQSIIERCKFGERVVLVNDPYNPYDNNAVAVFRMTGEQIGYLRKDWAAQMFDRLERGSPVTSKIVGLEPFWTDRGEMLTGVSLELVPYKIRRKSKVKPA